MNFIKDIGFFDENAVGVLTARLAEDATLVQGLTGQLLGLIVQNLVNLTAGLVIAFIYGWELTLVLETIFARNSCVLLANRLFWQRCL